MDATFSSIEGRLVLCFKPSETYDAALHMQLLLEDEKSRGHCVPNFDKDFFKDFAASEENFPVTFDFKHIDIAISFIEEVLDNVISYGDNVEKLEQFLNEVEEWYATTCHTIQ